MKPLILLATLFLSAAPTEKVVGHNVQFMVNKKHELVPILPIYLVARQEEGGIAEGLLTCNLIARDKGEGTVMVISCGNKKFEITGVNFTESK